MNGLNVVGIGHRHSLWGICVSISCCLEMKTHRILAIDRSGFSKTILQIKSCRPIRLLLKMRLLQFAEAGAPPSVAGQ